MSNRKVELLQVEMRFVKKGARFAYDEAESCLKHPIEEYSEELPITETKGENFSIFQCDFSNMVAKEDNVFFTFTPINLPLGDALLAEELSMCGANDCLDCYFEDFALIGKKIISNELVKYNQNLIDSRKKILTLQEVQIITPQEPPKEDYASFIALIEMHWFECGDYDGVEWDMEMNFKGILEYDKLLSSAVTLTEFLKDSNK